jgi:hypothetical protein
LGDGPGHGVTAACLTSPPCRTRVTNVQWVVGNSAAPGGIGLVSPWSASKFRIGQRNKSFYPVTPVSVQATGAGFLRNNTTT